MDQPKAKTFAETLDIVNGNIKKLRYKITMARTKNIPDPHIQKAENTMGRVKSQIRNLNRELVNAQEKLDRAMIEHGGD